MLINIHNLPPHTRYTDIEDLLLEKCGDRDYILDNLVPENGTMKVTVGVAEERDAALVVLRINGMFYHGLQLYALDKRLEKKSNQAYMATTQPSQQCMDYQSSQHQHKQCSAPIHEKDADIYKPTKKQPRTSSESEPKRPQHKVEKSRSKVRKSAAILAKTHEIALIKLQNEAKAALERFEASTSHYRDLQMARLSCNK